VHYGNGLLGTMMLAFMAKPSHVGALVGGPCGGVFYTSWGWLQLGMQTLGERAARPRMHAWGERRGGVTLVTSLPRAVARVLLGWFGSSSASPRLIAPTPPGAPPPSTPPPPLTLVTAFSLVVALAVFGVLKHFNLLRVEMSTELAGLDNMEHGGPAYEWNGQQGEGGASCEAEASRRNGQQGGGRAG
jgi:hypothetical protein